MMLEYFRKFRKFYQLLTGSHSLPEDLRQGAKRVEKRLVVAGQLGQARHTLS